jgi:hypothetical protein
MSSSTRTASLGFEWSKAPSMIMSLRLTTLGKSDYERSILSPRVPDHSASWVNVSPACAVATPSQTGAPPLPRPTLLGIDADILARIYEYSNIHDEPIYLRLQEQSHRRALARVYQQQREEMLLLSHNGSDFVPAAPRSWTKRYIAWPNREPAGFDHTYHRRTIGRGI